MAGHEDHSLYIAVVALTAANSITPIARRAKENSPRRTAVGSTRASRPAPERGGRRHGRMLLPPRSGAGHGTVLLPVLALPVLTLPVLTLPVLTLPVLTHSACRFYICSGGGTTDEL